MSLFDELAKKLLIKPVVAPQTTPPFNPMDDVAKKLAITPDTQTPPPIERPEMGQGIQSAPSAPVTPDTEMAPRMRNYGDYTTDEKIRSDTKDIGALQNKPLPVEEKLWRRLVNGLIYGIANGKGDTLGERLGSGLGGALSGTFSPQAEAQMRTQGKIDELANRLKMNIGLRDKTLEQQKQILSNQKTLGEIDTQSVKTINERLAPLMDVIKAQKVISPQMADYLTKTTGVPFTAAQWQEYIDKEVNGKIYSRPQYSPIYRENQTVPEDPTQVPRNVQIGKGQPLPLTPTQAAPIISSVEQANAGRQQNQQQFEESKKLEREKFNANQIQEANKVNASNVNNYNQEVYKATIAHAQQIGENLGNASKMQGIAEQMQRYADALGTIDTSTDEGQKQYNQVADDFEKSQTAFNNELAKSKAGQFILSQSKTPTLPQKINPALISNGSQSQPPTKTTTKAQVRAFAKSKGISLAEAIKQAKADGYKIQ